MLFIVFQINYDHKPEVDISRPVSIPSALCFWLS